MWFNYFCQCLMLQVVWWMFVYVWYFNVFVFIDDGIQCVIMVDFNGFSIVWWCIKGISDIVGYYVFCVRDYFGMMQCVVSINGDIYCIIIDIYDIDVQFMFIFC